MTKPLLALLGALTLSGCVTPTHMQATNDQLEKLHSDLNAINVQLAAIEPKPQPQPPERVCYLAGEKYSPGSVVAGRICEDIRMTRSPGQPPQYGWQRDL